MTTLAYLGMWFLAIVLILAFFAGARRVRGTARTAAYSPSVRDKGQEAAITPPMRETA